MTIAPKLIDMLFLMYKFLFKCYIIKYGHGLLKTHFHSPTKHNSCSESLKIKMWHTNPPRDRATSSTILGRRSRRRMVILQKKTSNFIGMKPIAQAPLKQAILSKHPWGFSESNPPSILLSGRPFFLNTLSCFQNLTRRPMSSHANALMKTLEFCPSFYQANFSNSPQIFNKI